MPSYSATVKGGFFGQYAPTLVGSSASSAHRRRIAQIFAKVPALRELATTLNGAAAGDPASATQKRVIAAEELGGVRQVETQTFVSRNTAAADVTAINADILTYGGSDSTPPINLDRNPLGEAA